MIKSGIYQIKNLINDKVYIGSAINIAKRWRDHKRSLNFNNHHSYHLQSSYNKYSKDNFEFTIIELVADKTTLIAREQYYINLHKSYKIDKGYNISPTAGSQLGIKFKDSSKIKMRISRKQLFVSGYVSPLKGKILSIEDRKKLSLSHQNMSNETRHKMSLSGKGREFSSEHKHKISIANTGKIRTQEQRENNSLAQMGKRCSEETKKKTSQTMKNYWKMRKENIKLNEKESIKLNEKESIKLNEKESIRLDERG